MPGPPPTSHPRRWPEFPSSHLRHRGRGQYRHEHCQSRRAPGHPGLSGVRTGPRHDPPGRALPRPGLLRRPSPFSEGFDLVSLGRAPDGSSRHPERRRLTKPSVEGSAGEAIPDRIYRPSGTRPPIATSPFHHLLHQILQRPARPGRIPSPPPSPRVPSVVVAPTAPLRPGPWAYQVTWHARHRRGVKPPRVEGRPIPRSWASREEFAPGARRCPRRPSA